MNESFRSRLWRVPDPLVTSNRIDQTNLPAFFWRRLMEHNYYQICMRIVIHDAGFV